MIEFIHFGFVHLSESHYFPNDKYSDTTKNKGLEADAKPRAIQFRSGVEREAILLSEFIRSTKPVLEERDAGRGASARRSALWAICWARAAAARAAPRRTMWRRIYRR